MSRLFGEPPRDPKLAESLRRIEAASPLGYGEPLRMKILAAAGPRLADLRAPARRWWEWISGWVRVAVPVGVAACLAAAMLVPRIGNAVLVEGITTVAGADSTLVLAAFSEPVAGNQLTAHLIVPESDELLAQALDQ